LALGKSAAARFIQAKKLMSRLVLLIIVVLLLVGGLVFLSTSAREAPTRTIEVDLPKGGNAS
jgi:hypothetical protein